MLKMLKSPFLRRFVAGFSLGTIGMLVLNVERVTAAPLF